MESLRFRIPWVTEGIGSGEPFPADEWLLTNGLGGYASATLTGYVTRRYHGFLIAAFDRPSIRRMMLSHIEETVSMSNRRLRYFGMSRQAEQTYRLGSGPESSLTEFRLDLGMPSWRFDFLNAVLEKEIVMPYGHNTTVIRYRLQDGQQPLSLSIQPLIRFRSHHESVEEAADLEPYTWAGDGTRFEVNDPLSGNPLRLAWCSSHASFAAEESIHDILYALERNRGYPALSKLWSPGRFEVILQPGDTAMLIASVEDWSEIDAVCSDDPFEIEHQRRHSLIASADPKANTPLAAQLVLAADQFLVSPARQQEATIAGHAGTKRNSIIAGYHWFTDWGRDTMISLEGLALVTGRFAEARNILRTFASEIRDGLVPNLFPEGAREPVYYTVDASLWFFHAVERYVELANDDSLIDELFPNLWSIVNHYRAGTRFGIGVDPADGLVRQGDLNHPLTWMDAKVEDWIVTPRRGKPVEINALWYNALRLFESWLRRRGDDTAAAEIARNAEQVWRSFNDRFWYHEGGYLYDLVDGENGDDSRCRPNQIFSFSLHYPVLDPQRWLPVFQTVRQQLVTPTGLRTLAPGHPGYQPVYFGNLRARDAAYHQGTVWPWLIGPYVDAWLRVHPEDSRVAHEFLHCVLRTMGTACIGSLSEIHDAEEPYTARGCIAQAWSVAELLRTYVKTVS